MHMNIPQEARIVEALAPATDAAGRSGAAVSLKHIGMAYVVAHITQGNAATILLTVQQCTDVTGAGAKAVPAIPVWSNLDTATNDTLVRAADAINYTTDAAVKNKIVIFQVDPAQLDMANSFDCIRVTTGASNVANITQAEYILTDLRYSQATPPSNRVD
jgi:hypothetical protein